MSEVKKAVITPREIGIEWGMSLPTVYNLLNQSGCPAFKLSSRKWIVPREKFEEWMVSKAMKEAG